MSTHKAIDKICVCAMLICLIVTVVFIKGDLPDLAGSERTMGYEETLFDTSRVHTIDIVMDDWDSFISTATTEEYQACSVVIDNEAVKNVAIRGKGNTSLSTVASLGSERYSFKLEFDHYEDGKNYHGLDKLCLTNLIQDNTYMKDYLTYRMMDEFGSDAPLCSFIWITVNGEDWGLYLAVEAVEDSFMQRTYGGSGDLYKPDSQSMGGGGPGNGKDFNMDDFLGEDEDGSSSDSSSGITVPEQGGNADPWGNGFGNDSDPWQGGLPGDSDTSDNGVIRTSTKMDQGGFDPSQGGPDQGGFDPGRGGPGQGGPGQNGEYLPEMPGEIDPEQDTPYENSTRGSTRGGMKGGREGMGSDDVKLIYTDDDPENYSNIFNNAKTQVTDQDKDRLIASLKNLKEGTDLEDTVDVDEVLRYFTVHNYVVNGDSYTGSMIHNYYLYENDGKLSMIPWDYNLAFGSFQGNSANSAVNDPIDTPLSVNLDGTRPMAEWFLRNEEYKEMYHEYFKEFLDTVDPQAIIDEAFDIISPYVSKDPTAFCTYEEFEKGVNTLKEFLKLRTLSVSGQLDGSIPSTDSAQNADSSSLIDASSIILSDMGNFGHGGNMRGAGVNGADNSTGNFGQGRYGFGGNLTQPGSGSEGSIKKPPNAGSGDITGRGRADGNARSENAQETSSPITKLTWITLGISSLVLILGLAAAKAFRRRKTS